MSNWVGQMIPLAGAALGGLAGGLPGASLGMALGGGFASSMGQAETNATNIALGREQMEFQERMRGSAYQAAVADMQKAGLNPMLAYSQGGASSPGGSMPQVANAAAVGMSSAAQGAGVASGVQAMAQSKAQTELIEAQAAKTRAETINSVVFSAQQSAMLRELEGRGAAGDYLPRQARLNTERSESELRERSAHEKGGAWAADVASRLAEAKARQLGLSAAKVESNFYESDTGSLSPWLRQLIEAVKGFSSARGALR